MDKTTVKKINKEIEDLNNNTSQLDLTVTYRTLHQTIAEDTFFSGPHETFSRIGHNTYLKKFKKI